MIKKQLHSGYRWAIKSIRPNWKTWSLTPATMWMCLPSIVQAMDLPAAPLMLLQGKHVSKWNIRTSIIMSIMFSNMASHSYTKCSLLMWYCFLVWKFLLKFSFLSSVAMYNGDVLFLFWTSSLRLLINIVRFCYLSSCHAIQELGSFLINPLLGQGILRSPPKLSHLQGEQVQLFHPSFTNQVFQIPIRLELLTPDY